MKKNGTAKADCEQAARVDPFGSLSRYSWRPSRRRPPAEKGKARHTALQYSVPAPHVIDELLEKQKSLYQKVGGGSYSNSILVFVPPRSISLS